MEYLERSFTLQSINNVNFGLDASLLIDSKLITLMNANIDNTIIDLNLYLAYFKEITKKEKKIDRTGLIILLTLLTIKKDLRTLKERFVEISSRTYIEKIQYNTFLHELRMIQELIVKTLLKYINL